VSIDSSFSIRHFTEDDLPHLCNLISETIEKCYTGVYPPKAVSFFHDYHSPEHIFRDAEAGIILVALLNQKLVATATLTENYVRRVFVHPSFYKESELVKRLLKKSKD
jgi:hypothetical protein